MDNDLDGLSPLAGAILAHTGGNTLPLHMPGHKRNPVLLPEIKPYELDITEINGFDNLHRAQGVLLEAQARAAKLWGSRRCFYLVGGSTCGILAAVRASTRPGDTVLVARNCHRSVYHAIELCGLKPVYIFPAIDAATGIAGSIAPAQVNAALTAHPDAALVILTSPTYEGVISDISAIAEAAHVFGIPILVDGAHGAHLGLSPQFPDGAVKSGADIVIMSLHKTLPALTQTALAHVSGGLVDDERLARELSVFETSSPSYVLMASIDACVGLLAQSGEKLFSDYAAALDEVYRRAESLKNLRVLNSGREGLPPSFFGFDQGKLVVGTRGTGMSGAELAGRLRERYDIEVEMACADYIVAMTSICDSGKSLRRFADALIEIDGGLTPREAPLFASMPEIQPEIMLPACEAVFHAGEDVAISQAEGRTALEYLWAYPPGIPLVVPGEAITADVLRTVASMARAGVEVVSASGSADAIFCAF